MSTLPNPFLNSAEEPAMAAESAAAPGLTDPPVAAADDFRFVLDVDAFMGAIDGAPAFLANPTPEYLAILQVLADIEPIRAAIARR